MMCNRARQLKTGTPAVADSKEHALCVLRLFFINISLALRAVLVLCFSLVAPAIIVPHVLHLLYFCY